MVDLPQSYNVAGSLLIFPSSAVARLDADSADVMEQCRSFAALRTTSYCICRSCPGANCLPAGSGGGGNERNLSWNW